MNRNWYKVKNLGGVLNVSIHEEIGLFGVSARDFIDDINSQDVKEIVVSIHSPGGNGFDGLAMYNALVNHPAHITTEVVGVAASAASIVLMAGDVRRMPEEAFIMIHNPMVGVMGGAAEMREAADFLDKVKQTLVSVYTGKVKISEDEIIEMMDAETWMNGQEAERHGFVTETTKIKVAALSRGFANHFKKPPLPIKGADYDAISNLSSAKEIECFLRESGGQSKGAATALLARFREVSRSESAVKSEELVSQALTNLANISFKT